MPAIDSDLTEQPHPGERLPTPRPPGLRRSLADRRNHASREQLLHRVRAEFEELRGLTLTLAQARRLFGLREDICFRVLDTLIRDGLLRRAEDNFYARRRGDA
jgi:hypothetical protein